MGSILEIIPVLPITGNLFPIYLYTLRGSAMPYTKYIVSFWGINVTSQYYQLDSNNKIHFVTEISKMNGPRGWTILGLPSFLMIFIYIALGILGIILSLQILFKFMSPKNVKGMNTTILTGIISGLITLFLDLLLFWGTANDRSHAGLSLLPLPPVFKMVITISLGYWCLVLAGLFIVFGSLIQLQFNSKTLKNIFNPFRNNKSGEEVVTKTPSSQINQFLNEIDEIIHDTH